MNENVCFVDEDNLKNNYSRTEAVKSILQSNVETDKIREFINVLNIHSIQQIEKIEDLLLTYLLNYNNKNIDDYCETNTLLSNFFVHKKSKADVINCYNINTKSNPASVWYPHSNSGRSVYTENIFHKKYNLLDKSTPIGSAGSCFAIEIANYMQTNGFNYIVKEDNKSILTNTHSSCARYGTIFNASAFRQLIEVVFYNKQLPNYVWRKLNNEGRIVYNDPFREEIEFDTIDQYFTSKQQTIDAAKKAFSETKIFIITLGLNEVWKFKSDHSVCSRNPWNTSPSYVYKQILSVENNVDELQKMLDLWRQYNPEIQFIISVSPVPMIRTFQGEKMHIMTANMMSKATLLLAANEFANNNTGVYYFPSFEKIMYGIEKPFMEDFRHINKSAVNTIMKMFEFTYLKM